MSMIGKSLGNFECTALLGKGGMGEVYRAKDQKLGRDVAIKVLPEEFARDADRVARFQREAKLLASLNHPNVASIYGLEESDGIHFLVLELIEGDTLADRIKSGPIPVEESLKLALQIAEALEAAHEKGVIHRDLKPANIKVTPDVNGGKRKVSTSSLGIMQKWSPDGRKLYYWTMDALMVVEVETEPTFKPGTPAVLLQRMPETSFSMGSNGISWDVRPDGKFLMLKPATEPGSESTAADSRKINIVLNWFEELKERVPAR